MPSSKSSFKFTAPLESVKAPLISTVIYLPDQVMKDLPKARVRVKGTMNDAPFALAVQYRKTGKSFFVVSSALRRAAKIKPGDKVDIRFKLVDSEKVELPEELEAVLEQDKEGMQAWKAITPGLQRGLCHYINSVKNVDSRIKRALYLVNKVKSGAYVKAAKKKD